MNQLQLCYITTTFHKTGVTWGCKFTVSYCIKQPSIAIVALAVPYTTLIPASTRFVVGLGSETSLIIQRHHYTVRFSTIASFKEGDQVLLWRWVKSSRSKHPITHNSWIDVGSFVSDFISGIFMSTTFCGARRNYTFFDVHQIELQKVQTRCRLLQSAMVSTTKPTLSGST